METIVSHWAEHCCHCINPTDPETHVTGSLLNIWCGQVVQPNVNFGRALDIGVEQMIQFERSWPEGFYTLLSKEVVTFNTKKKRLAVGEHAVVDQEAIYARVIGLLVSQRDLNFQEVLATELTAYHLQTSASSHEIWEKEYLMPPNRS